MRSNFKPVANIRDVSLALLSHYAEILADIGFDLPAPDGTSSAHLAWMCESAITESATWPADQLSRWLGFVQGVMSSRGQISTDFGCEVPPAAFGRHRATIVVTPTGLSVLS